MTTNKAEQSSEQSGSEDNFDKLSLEQMEAELSSTPQEVSKESEGTDQGKKDSESTEQKSEAKEEVVEEKKEVKEVKEAKTESKSDKSSEVDNKNEKSKSDNEDTSALSKNYKELQGEFTRRSQELKALRADKLALEERLSAIEEKVQGNKQEKSEKAESIIAKLKEKSPEAAQLFQSFQEEIMNTVDEMLTEKLNPIVSERKKSNLDQNVNAFKADIDKFLSSDLKELEPEMTQYIQDNYDVIQELVQNKPNAFELVKKEVINANLDKVVSIISKSKESKSESKTNQRKSDIENADVGKGSQTSKKSTALSETDFNNLSHEEMEKKLPHSE